MREHGAFRPVAKVLAPTGLTVLLMFSMLGLLQIGHVWAQTYSPDVIGGDEAEPGSWPWMAALVYAGVDNAYLGHFCGGTLVRPEWVLTAAHCTQGLSPAHIDVVLGRHQLSSSDGERIAVAEIVRYPGYNPNMLDSDLALLRLAVPSEQSPIDLIGRETADLAAPFTLSTVIGWGTTSATQNAYPDALRQVIVPIVSNETCNALESYGGAVTDNMLCAGYGDGGVDSCTEDSGGPLIVPSSDGVGWIQAGIVSWGYGCALPNYYGVYTQLANFEGWINSEINSTPLSVSMAQQLWLPLVLR